MVVQRKYLNVIVFSILDNITFIKLSQMNETYGVFVLSLSNLFLGITFLGI